MNAQTSTPAHQAECAHRLESLVRRASTFIAQQLGQLDDLALQMAAELRTSPCAEGVTDRDQAEWLRQKAEDERRIEEQLDHLASAWKDLESEQRRLMTLDRAPHQPSFQSAPAMVSQASEAESEPALATGPQPDAAPRSRDLIDATAPQDAAAAALQFQKLKREIRQQTRRQR